MAFKVDTASNFWFLQANSHVIKHDHSKITPRSPKPSQKLSNSHLTWATGGANRIQAHSWTTSAGYTRTSFPLKVMSLLVSHPAMTLTCFTLRRKIQIQCSNLLLPLLEPNGHGLHFQKEGWLYVLDKLLLIILYVICCEANSCLHSLWTEKCKPNEAVKTFSILWSCPCWCCPIYLPPPLETWKSQSSIILT